MPGASAIGVVGVKPHDEGPESGGEHVATITAPWSILARSRIAGLTNM